MGPVGAQHEPLLFFFNIAYILLDTAVAQWFS
jgi:hypothetical protein